MRGEGWPLSEMVQFSGHSLRLTLFLSVSLTASYSVASSLHSIFPIRSFSQSLPPKVPRATPSDLLSLLGPSGQSSSVKPQVAEELRSCLHFLVPFSPAASDYSSRRRSCSGGRKLRFEVNDPREENQLVWWPPEPILDLARLSFDTRGDPGAIHRTLDPSIIPVPDVEDSKRCRCQLTRTPYGRRFISKELNQYMEFLFKLIAARGPDVGLNVSLNRYDLFHGHLFLSAESGRLGILFHAKEYPKYDKKKFPHNMGYCQSGSDLTYDDSMNLRNILWLAPLPTNSSEAWSSPGVLVVLDARPGGIIYRDFVPEYVDLVRTIYEDEFGVVAVDVNYLNVGSDVPNRQIFIC